MARADFYLLPVAEPHGRLSFACRLAEKAWLTGHRVYLNGGDEAQARALDELLWSFRPSSFVAHELCLDASAAPSSPVVIGTGRHPEGHDDVLINLADEVPSFAASFARVAEIVLNEPEALAASRRRWSHYRERGFTLEHHDMQQLRSARG